MELNHLKLDSEPGEFSFTAGQSLWKVESDVHLGKSVFHIKSVFQVTLGKQ